MIRLNVNIDHVATLRQARGGVEPDPVAAVSIAELAGAQGIVCHLREDRRHVNDRDVRLIREIVQTKMDLEMAANEEIIKIALDTKPELVTIVPEKRRELTTEGGLNMAVDIDRYKKLSGRFHDKGIEVSYFIEPDEKQIDAALAAEADMVEIHTGIYANARGREAVNEELKKIINACQYASNAGLQIAAGHGLNYFNTRPICFLHEIDELSIGHAIMARAVFAGLDKAVREMVDLINTATLHRNIDL